MKNLLLTKRDIAQLCQVSIRTIDTWITERKIPVIHLSKRCVRFREDAVVAALQKFERRAVV
jgi:predicted site-specific integrase-resolvase